MKKIIINTAVCIVLVVLILFSLPVVDSGLKTIRGISFVSIQTASMSPALDPGDLAVIYTADCDDLRPNDIICYWTIYNGMRCIHTGRIENVYASGVGNPYFEVKADAHASADLMAVKAPDVIGKVVISLPLLGKLMDYFQTSTGFIVLILIIAAAIVFLVIYNKRTPKERRPRYVQPQDSNDEYTIVH